jgi:GxxExxY protein
MNYRISLLAGLSKYTALASPTTQMIGVNQVSLIYMGLESTKPTPGDTAMKIFLKYQDFHREYHRILGPGLLENVYRQCLAYELKELNIPYSMEFELPVMYKNVQITCGFRADIVVHDTLLVETKCVMQIHPIHEAQLLTYILLYL